MAAPISLISGPTPAAVADGYTNPTASAIYSLGGVWNGTGWDRQKEGAVAGSALVDVADRSGRALGVVSVTGAVYQGQVAAPTDAQSVTNAWVAPQVYNGASWDRQRSATSSDATAGIGIPASGAMGWDATGSVYRRLLADTSGSLLTKPGLGASGIADASSSGSLFATGGFVYNGATWDRGRAMTSLTGSNGTVGVQAVMPMVTDGSGTYALRISLSDATNNALNVGGFVYNGTNWDRARAANSANATTGTGIPGVAIMGWDGTNYQRIGTGANVTDGTNNQGLGVVNLVYNGVNWDKLRTANTASNSTGTGLLGVGALGWDGTNYQRLGAVAGDTGQNMLVTGGNRKEVSFTTTTAQALAATDVSNYRWVSVHIVTQGTASTVVFQTSNDNTNWQNVSLIAASGSIASAQASTTGAATIYHGPIAARYFRLNVTGISAGTTAGVIEFFSAPAAMQSMGVVNVPSGTAVTTDAMAASGSAGPMNSYGLVYNGATWDRMRSTALSGDTGILAVGMRLQNSSTTTALVASAGFTGDGASLPGAVSVGSWVYNGTNWDRMRSWGSGSTGVGAVAAGMLAWDYVATTGRVVAIAPGAPTGTLATAPMASSTGGATPFKLIAAATTNATNVKASAGTVYSLTITNVNAAVRYVKLYDKASAPTVGTDVPVHTYAIPANASHAVTITLPTGMGFANGIGLAITAAAADGDATAVTAGDVILNIDYK